MSSNVLSLLSLSSSLLFGVSFGTNVTCEGNADCTYSDYEADDILCRGYKSCWSSDLNATEECACNGLYACHGSDIYAGDNVVCFGEYGCKYADVTSDGNIWCDGRYGCKFTDLTAENNIYCDGEYACRLNDIYGANYLYVEGAGGAQVSNIYNFNRIYSWGYVALTQAYFNTSGVETPIATFGGYKTTVDATFICATGSTCYIYCTSDTGCEDLDVYCYGTCSVSCDDSWQQCPNETDASSDKFYEHVLLEKLAQRETKRQEEREQESQDDKLKFAPIKNNKNLNHNNGIIVNGIINSNDSIDFKLLASGFGGFFIAILLYTVWNNCKNNKNLKMQRNLNSGYQSI